MTLRSITGHVVVDTSAGKDDLRVVANLFGFVREIVKSHQCNALLPCRGGTAEIPLAACASTSVVSIRSRSKITESSLTKAMLRSRADCFDDFCRFSNFKAGFQVPALHDAAVKSVAASVTSGVPTAVIFLMVSVLSCPPGLTQDCNREKPF